MASDYNLNEVFENSKNIPASYVSREIDFDLEAALNGKTHIILFGSSGQGKTTLRKKWIDNYGVKSIIIHCFEYVTFSELNKSILKNAGYKIVVAENTENSNRTKETISLSFDNQIKLGYQKENEKIKNSSIEHKNLEIDLNNINDVVQALLEIKFNKIIVLEEFHQLKFEVQKRVAESLKVHFDETGIKFVIIGVWLEENKIVSMNGNLGNRSVTINADDWNEKSLRDVIENGCKKLNIEFDEKIINQILEDSVENISILKEICFEICKEKKVLKTYESDKSYLIDSANLSIHNIINRVINSHCDRYQSFVNSLINHSELKLAKYLKSIIKMIMNTDFFTIKNGVKSISIYKYLTAEHKDEEISTRELNSFLLKLNELQNSMSIVPTVINYNENTGVLYIVDRRFLLWLQYQDSEYLNIQLGNK